MSVSQDEPRLISSLSFIAEILYFWPKDLPNVAGMRFLLQEKGGKLLGAQVGCAPVANPPLVAGQ